MDAALEHVPVLLEQVVAGLAVRPGGLYVDATIGAGGHATGILKACSPDGRLLGLDADPDAIRFARQLLQPFGERVRLLVANFRTLYERSSRCGFGQVDGVLFDLGLSSRQLADASRGFAFALDAPLDMRYDPSQGETASELISRLSRSELADLLRRYGEERYAGRIARAIVDARPISTTGELARLVENVVPRRERIHPATRTFQALRIAVNQELDALSEALPQALRLLRPGGRLAVISFHSLEDRIVKRFFQAEAKDCLCPPDAPVCTCGHKAALWIVTRKPITPTEAEVQRNPRSRSARLRVAEKVSVAAATAQAFA